MITWQRGHLGLVWNERSRHHEPAMQPQGRRKGLSGNSQRLLQILQVCWSGGRSSGEMDRKCWSGLSTLASSKAESIMGRWAVGECKGFMLELTFLELWEVSFETEMMDVLTIESVLSRVLATTTTTSSSNCNNPL